MPDPVVPAPETMPSAPAAEAAPAIAAPAVEAQAVAAAPVEAAVEAPAVATEDPVESAPVETVEAVKPEPTLLEKFDQEKAADKPADGAKPAEAAVEAPGPVYQEFQLPEGLTADAEKMSAYTGVLGKYAIPQEAGQDLINLHADAMKAYAEHVSREQHRVWAETQEGWTKQVLADPEIGGAGHRTAMATIARMRDLFVPEAERAAFKQFLDVTGAGNHPVFLKMLHRAARYADEPAPVQPHSPPPNLGKPPGGRLRDIYTHPRSTPSGRQ